MVKRTLLSSAIVLAGSFGTAAALAQTEQDQWGDQTAQEEQWGQTSQQEGLPNFEELDTDGDGFLSQEELEQNAELADVHDQLDENADGLVDRTEFAALEQTHGMESGGMDQKDRETDYQDYEQSDTDY